MEFLEALFVLPGGYHRLFYDAPDVCFTDGGDLLPVGLCHDHFYHRQKADLRRSGVRLAFFGMYHFPGKRCAAFLPGNPGTVSFKNLHGGKTASYLYCKRRTLIKRALHFLNMKKEGVGPFLIK